MPRKQHNHHDYISCKVKVRPLTPILQDKTPQIILPPLLEQLLKVLSVIIGLRMIFAQCFLINCEYPGVKCLCFGVLALIQDLFRSIG